MSSITYFLSLMVFRRLTNARNHQLRDWGTKGFKVFLSLDIDNESSWVKVLEETLEDPRPMNDPLPLVEFAIAPTFARYVKFEIISFYGSKGGGLQYFAVGG